MGAPGRGSRPFPALVRPAAPARSAIRRIELMAPAKAVLETAAPLVPPRPTLVSLRAAAAGCKACDLWKRGTQTVFGEGARRAARHARRRAARQRGGPRRASVRRPRGPAARQGARRGRDRAEPDLRHERREALQVGAARQAAHPRQARRARDHGLPALAGGGARGGEAGDRRLPGRHRGPGPARARSSG